MKAEIKVTLFLTKDEDGYVQITNGEEIIGLLSTLIPIDAPQGNSTLTFKGQVTLTGDRKNGT